MRKSMPEMKKSHAHAFPAIHIRMDRWQYIYKFSSEILVAGLVIIVCATNVALHFTAKGHDASLAMQLLSNHPEYNPKVYAQNNAIVTSVEHNSIFASQAYAETILASDQATISDPNAPDNNAQDNTDDELNYIQENGIQQPKLDSIKDLMAASIHIHTVLRTDTIYTLSEQYGVSVQTIMTVNKLTSRAIKPGWVLVFPPHDNELVIKITDPNSTIPDFAAKYKANVEDIVAANGLPDPDTVPDVGQFLLIPGGVLPPPPAAPKPKPGKKSPIEPGHAVGGHIFPRGYCTWGVAQLVGGVPWGGDAAKWGYNAQAMGYTYNKVPGVGKILVTNDDRRHGHVALVIGYSGDTITVKEMNYTAFGKYDTRTINVDSSSIKGYITYK